MKALSATEVELLKTLYIEYDTPVDSFARKWDRLVELTNEFNRKIRGKFQPQELFDFMVTKRKGSKWPRIRRQYNGRQVKKVS